MFYNVQVNYTDADYVNENVHLKFKSISAITIMSSFNKK